MVRRFSKRRGAGGIEWTVLSPSGDRGAYGGTTGRNRTGPGMARQACTGIRGAMHRLHRRCLYPDRRQRVNRSSAAIENGAPLRASDLRHRGLTQPTFQVPGRTTPYSWWCLKRLVPAGAGRCRYCPQRVESILQHRSRT
jgi:hypothetical protein